MRGHAPTTLSRAASRLYAQFEHLEVDGEPEGWPIAVLCAAVCRPIDDFYDLLTAVEDPWAPAFDPELAAEVLEPEFAAALLPWLGQFAGVRNREGLPPAGQRLHLQETQHAKTGTTGAIVAAARARAIGPDGTPESATVILVERVGGDAYHNRIVMRTSEVPDPAATVRDINAEMPAGRFGTTPPDLFDFVLVDGEIDYLTLLAFHATYALVDAAFATYAELLENPSGV